MLMKNSDSMDGVFSRILQVIEEKLNGDRDKHFLAAIVALGHLAFHLPDKFSVQLKNLVSRNIVKELLLIDVTPARDGEEAWCTFEELCLETQSKVEGMKMMAKWLFGLKTAEVAAQKTLRMLNLVIENGGDLGKKGKPNPAERAWLRLAAGCAMLKICEQKCLSNQFTTQQYYNLGKLVTDPVVQVREQFLMKLNKGLGRGIPTLQNLKPYLPTEFQHSSPKNEANPAVDTAMGSPMYTGLGQLASKSKLNMSVEEAFTSNVVMREEVGLGKRTKREWRDEPKTKKNKL